MVHLLVSLLVPMCLLVVHLQGDTALNQLPEVAQSSLPVARHIEGNTVCFECACFMRVCAVGGYRAACSTSICRVRSLMLASMACCSVEICTRVHTQRRFPHKPLPYSGCPHPFPTHPGLPVQVLLLEVHQGGVCCPEPALHVLQHSLRGAVESAQQLSSLPRQLQGEGTEGRGQRDRDVMGWTNSSHAQLLNLKSIHHMQSSLCCCGWGMLLWAGHAASLTLSLRAAWATSSSC